MFNKMVSMLLTLFLTLNIVSVYASDGYETTQSGIEVKETTQNGIGIDMEVKILSVITTPQAIISTKREPVKLKEPIYKPSTKYKGNITNVKVQKYTYKEMVNEIKSMQINYKEFVTISSIGKSTAGNNLYMISLGNPRASKVVLMTASIHAREYITTQLVMRQLEYYMQNFYKPILKGKTPYSAFKEVRLDIVPMLNPDGVILCQQGLNAIPEKFRKVLLKGNSGSESFSQWKSNIVGVDLNRNFDVYWSKQKGKDIGPSPKEYTGVSPNSEMETKALLKQIDKVAYKGVIAYHACGEIIYWYEEQPSEDLLRDKSIAIKISNMTGYSLEPPDIPGLGGMRDWFVKKKHLPGLTIEVGTANGGVPVDIKQFPRIFSQNRLVPVQFMSDINVLKLPTIMTTKK